MYASAMLDEYYTTPLAYLNEVIMFRKNFMGGGWGGGGGEVFKFEKWRRL